MKMSPKIPERKRANIAAAVLYFIAAVFLLMVLIGNVNGRSAALSSIYFFRLNVANIIPISTQGAVLLNSVARSLGLHDFYQVGLWNFCEGYLDEGVTYCSPPRRFFWFNPVEVLTSELLSGAQIALPTQVNQILDLLKLGQQAMFGFFIAAFVLVLVVLAAATPLVPRSRWWSLPAGVLAAAAAVCATAATVLASVMSVAAHLALTQQEDLNISADIGRPMFAFMWIAAICTDLAAIFHLAMGCFCAPQRSRYPHLHPPAVLSATEPQLHAEDSVGAAGAGGALSEKGRSGRGFRLPDFLSKRRKGGS